MLMVTVLFCVDVCFLNLILLVGAGGIWLTPSPGRSPLRRLRKGMQAADAYGIRQEKSGQIQAMRLVFWSEKARRLVEYRVTCLVSYDDSCRRGQAPCEGTIYIYICVYIGAL